MRLVRLFLGALGLAAALAAPSTAAAASYDVHLCKAPSGEGLPLTGWTATPSGSAPGASSGDSCRTSGGPTGTGLWSTIQGQSSYGAGTEAKWEVTVPAETPIERVRWAYDAEVSPAPSSCAFSFLDGKQLEYGCRAAGAFSVRGATNSATPFDGQTARTFRFGTICRDGCSGAAADASFYVVRDAVFTLRDDAGPGFARPPTGPLLDPDATQSGTREAFFEATDAASGVYRAVVEVDGQPQSEQVVDENGGLCRPPWTRPKPCSGSVTGAVSLDTTKLSDGPHAVRIVLSDAAGNQTAFGPVTIRTSNPRPGADAGRGAANGDRPCAPCALFAGGGKKFDKARLRIRRKAKAEIRGRLLQPSGEPVAGATLDVRSEAGVEATVRTGVDGSFAYAIPPGPTRHLTIAYRAYANDPTYAAERRLLVRVSGAVQLAPKRRRLSRGKRVVLRGRLAGAPLPESGAVVTIEGRVKGSRRWLRVDDPRAGSDGRFVGKFRFTERKGRRIVYELRARVRRQAGFPFPTDRSRVITIAVRS